MPNLRALRLLAATLVVSLLVACGAAAPPPAPPGAAAHDSAPAAGAAPAPADSRPQDAPPAPAAPAAPAAPKVRSAPALVSTTLAVPPALRRGVFGQDRHLEIQHGFAISVFALVAGARSMTVAPWGELLVTQPGRQTVVALRDDDGDGVADSQRPLAQGLECPYGMAFREGFLYVAQSTKVERFAHNDGAGLGPAELVVGGLPQSGCGPHHYRPLAFDWTGSFYVAFGSSCNVCVEPDARRGTVWQFGLDGSGREYARGLRNVVDLEMHPLTGDMWAATNERDSLGDDVPPEPVGPVAAGADYGWPFCYWTGDRWVIDTRVPVRNPGCGGLATYNGLQAHTAPLGIAFYTGAQFPEDYRASAFVALHGSWNRSVGVGFKVMRIPAAEGAPQPAEDFVTGWLTGPRGPQDAWGRPVDVQLAPGGALFVSDDRAGAIYRVTYVGEG